MKIPEKILDVSVSDPDVKRRGRLLNILLIGVGFVTVFALILLAVTDVLGLAKNTIVLYFGVILMLTGVGLIYILNRQGKVDFASTIFLALFTIVFTFADTPQNVVQGRTLFMFVIPVLMASFLLRPYASFVIALVVSGLHVILAITYAVPKYSPIGLVAFFVVALIAWLVARNLEEALAELRDINRQLDLRVIERTKELADANLQLEDQARELVHVNWRLELQAQELENANRRLTELDTLKSKFVSDVSHELRTPISNLRIYLEMLEGAPPEKRERYRSVLEEETRRLENLVSDILDLSRMEMGRTKIEFAWLDINTVVDKLVAANQPQAEDKGLELTFVPGSNLPKVLGDENQLSQVINNLVGNAINYTPAGSVKVKTQIEAENRRIRLDVQDTGLGIDHEDLPHLFERFYRGKQAGQSTIPGSGLGLAITKEIVDAHGGQIEVHSEQGQGSAFVVFLPIEQPKIPGDISSPADMD